jgi:hypothetical protein
VFINVCAFVGLFYILYVYFIYNTSSENQGHTEAQLFEALRFKPEVCGIDYRWCHRNFSLTYGPGVDSASNGNEYQEYFLGVKAAGV